MSIVSLPNCSREESKLYPPYSIQNDDNDEIMIIGAYDRNNRQCDIQKPLSAGDEINSRFGGK